MENVDLRYTFIARNDKHFDFQSENSVGSTFIN